MRLPDPSPLLALVNATAEWHAGVTPVCSASVRLLDRVHFMVYRGDCVVVHHDDPAGARVLLAALGGHHALTAGRRLMGQRVCAPGVRIRRCSITVGAAQAVRESWDSVQSRQQGSVPRGVGAAAADEPVVHLLRASRQAAIGADERRQWRHWAERAYSAGGAVVVVEPPATAGIGAHRRPASPRPTDSTAIWRSPEALHESAAPEYSGAAPSRSNGSPATRELWLHHGRLFNLRTWQ